MAMATLDCDQLILKLQKKLPGLDFEQLKIVACKIGTVDKERMRNTSMMSEPEVFNLIVDFARSIKQEESKDKGVSHLLHLLEVVENLLGGTSSSKVLSQAVRLTDCLKFEVNSSQM